MRRSITILFAGFLVLGVMKQVYAAGSAYQLTGYATAGTNPTVVFIVMDNQGNGVRGIPVDITSSAGTLDVTSGTTGPDGTLTVKQSGGSLGDQITATCASVTEGSPLMITSSDAQTVKSTDLVYLWYDESRRLANAVVVTAGTGVLTSNSLFNFYRDDYSSDNRTLAIGTTTTSQSAAGPAQSEVMQGTFNSGDRVRVDETTVSGNPNANIYFSGLQPSRMLYAYAAGGANPAVCAVVTDSRGVGVEGVTVTAACSGGSFLAATGYTTADGACFFQQTGGSLGDTLTVSCPTLAETSPVKIVTEDSPAISATNKIFSWFARKTRKVYTAMTDRVANVLVTPGAADHVLQNFVNISGNGTGPYGQTGGVFTDQTPDQPAVTAAITFGVTEAGDLIRIYQDTVIYRNSTYQSILELPANESQYLLAFATGGANPTVWAAVTDGDGNAATDVPVHFDLQGTGSLSQSNTVTGWSGYAWSAVSGAAAVGNTITVSSPGLGTVTIFTADAQSPTATDRVYAWYDPATHKIFAAPVTFENNVMNADGTTISAGSVKKHTGNNSIYYCGFTPVASPWPCLGHIGYGTIEGGDHIIIYEAATSQNYDTYIIADPDPAKFLVAFAEGGVDPRVWAVVMDGKCNALEGEPVSFTAAQGAMSLANTVTGWGGMVISQHTSSLLGNTLTVSASGLPPVTIYTAPAVNLTSGDRSAVWYDASRFVIWGSQFTLWNNIITANTSYGTSALFDNTPSNNRTLSVNDPLGHNLTRLINPLAQWIIAQGSAGVGDEIRLSHYTYYSFVRIESLRSSYLRAYAVSGQNPSLVRALMIDGNGVGIPDVSVNFTCTNGFMANGPGWKTGFDGTVDSAQTSGVYNDVITVSSPGYPPVQILTNNSGGVSGTSPTLAWYSPVDRKLNAAVLQYACYNVTVSNVTPSISFVPEDSTVNNKTVAVSGPKEDAQQQPTYGYVAEGTSGPGDVIRVQTMSASAADDATVVLPDDTGQYLWAFASGGANPAIWAAVTDASGNGIGGVPVRIVYPGPVTVNLVTDASGATANTRAGVNVGDVINVTADGCVNTVTVKAANPAGVDPSTRTLGWYDVLNRTGYAAFVNVPNHVLASGTNAAFTPIDTTANGLTFALGTPVQQTTGAPASCPIINGTQGQDDIIGVGETNTSADPDLQLSICVSSARLMSSLAASPTAVTGQYIYVTMTVTNTGAPAALSVTASSLGVAGGAAWVSGPDPALVDNLDGGNSVQICWTYRATEPGGVTFTGQAFATDSYTLQGVTSTANDSNLVSVRDPHAPMLTVALAASPAVLTAGSPAYPVYVTMTVTNSSDGDVPAPLTVTPSALVIAGSTTLTPRSGPLPASQIIPRGSFAEFHWIYDTASPGSVTLTGQAYTLNPFDASGVTSAAVSSNGVTIQSPPALSLTLAGPAQAERLLDFTLTLTVSNTGQATADSVAPIGMAWSGTGIATWVSGPTPSEATIPGGESRDFTWAYKAGDQNGTLQFYCEAQGLDANTGFLVSAAGTSTNAIQVIQGALNLDGISTAVTEAYRGQKGLLVAMQARNTSQMPVTLTAAALNFNGSPNGYTVVPLPSNPVVVPPESLFTLQFRVDVGKNAPLGETLINGSLSGDAGPAGTMSANGAQETASWQILEVPAVNRLRQNYPNPLRLSKSPYTTFEYFLTEDVRSTLKLYNLAGELVAVLVDGSPGVGRHTATWDGRNGDPGQRGSIVGSGVYLAVFRSGDYQETKKVVVIR